MEERSQLKRNRGRYVQAYKYSLYFKIDTWSNCVIWVRKYRWAYPRFTNDEYFGLVLQSTGARIQHGVAIERQLWYGDVNEDKNNQVTHGVHSFICR